MCMFRNREHACTYTGAYKKQAVASEEMLWSTRLNAACGLNNIPLALCTRLTIGKLV
uniref:Uncharacterized protein n=1 Tax=Arundo donax TaxID=35708 RepID=A0A0A9EWD0_ARUDO